MDGLAGALAGAINNGMRDAARDSLGTGLAKIVSVDGGGFYTIQTADGRTIRFVQNVAATQWKPENWVSYEMASGAAQITRSGSHQSE